MYLIFEFQHGLATVAYVTAPLDGVQNVLVEVAKMVHRSVPCSHKTSRFDTSNVNKIDRATDIILLMITIMTILTSVQGLINHLPQSLHFPFVNLREEKKSKQLTVSEKKLIMCSQS